MSPSPPGYADSHLKIHVQADAVVLVAGEVDTMNCGELHGVVQRLLTPEAPARVVLDMNEVTFLDSAGVRALLTCREDAAARGSRLVVHRPHENVRQVLTICGVDRLFA